ncbi:hypothetical protein H5410_040423 [Solanum commersonii]|uniref:Myb/SANT-like domain-containing protein n=1 Tax=Solanum commersonii TaxID=4109 RepID=A0A9J5XQ23_SOLCO|nr:hypothetical protein H5410_040423 [Solanum commersonii]
MKAEWTLFKQLMRGDTCIGWDATKNIIMADDDWWKKFRNKDLSLIWFRYDALFSDIVATGERARPSNQSQFLETEVYSDEERPNGIDNDDMEHFINSNNEGGGESDDPQNMDSTMFPTLALKRPNSTDGIGTSNHVKKSKTKSTVASMKEDMHSLVELMSNKSTATSHAVDDPTIDKCMDFLANIPGIFERGEMYNYFVNIFLKKDIRQVFLKMPTDEARKDIVLATMAIHNYIKQKCNVDDAFQTAKDERYIPSVDSEFGTSSSTNNIEENMEEQSDTYWMGLRDMIANEIDNV